MFSNTVYGIMFVSFVVLALLLLFGRSFVRAWKNTGPNRKRTGRAKLHESSPPGANGIIPGSSEDEIRIIASTHSVTLYKCGHVGPFKYRLSLYGQLCEELRDNEFCSNCTAERIEKLSARCGRCGSIILPGDSVAHLPKSLFNCVAQWANFKDGGTEDEYISCLSSDCCTDARYFSGYWTESGFVSAYPDKSSGVVTIPEKVEGGLASGAHA